MCWYGTVNDEKVAKRDLRVMKVLYKPIKISEHINLPIDLKDYFIAPYAATFYEIGKRYEQDIMQITTYDTFGDADKLVIEKGLHSFSKSVKWKISKLYNIRAFTANTVSVYCVSNMLIPAFKFNQATISGNFELKLVECIIPKGTKYYRNNKGDIVSEALIVTGKIIDELCVGSGSHLTKK